MSRRSKANFKASINSQFPTNGTGQVGASRIRAYVGEDVADSFVNNVDDLQLFTISTGTNSYAFTGAITAYASGFAIIAKFATASTGACTVNVNTIGAVKLFKTPTTQAGSGDIPINLIALLVYDATLDSNAGGFLIMTPLAAGGLDSLIITVTSAVVFAMANKSERSFEGNTKITGARVWSLTDASSAVFIPAFTFEIDAGAAQTLPASSKLLTPSAISEFSGGVWTPTLTGFYRAQAYKNGSVWWWTIEGPAA
jgi:hypothetical protein